MTVPTVPLNDGHQIPQIGLGTWPLNDDEAASVVATAIAAGYRHIDTATRYGLRVPTDVRDKFPRFTAPQWTPKESAREQILDTLDTVHPEEPAPPPRTLYEAT